MIKGIMLSIRPEHAVDILNGKKTLELRKSVPKDFVGWIYIYVTKPRTRFRVLHQSFYKDYLFLGARGKYVCDCNFEIYACGLDYSKHHELNGKVVARFWFDEYNEYYYNGYQGDYRLINKNDGIFRNATMNYEALCLNEKEVNAYGKERDYLYIWNIKRLKIFEEPMGLNEFYRKKVYPDTTFIDPLEQPPQSWQYVYTRE